MSAVALRADTALGARRKSRFGCRNCKLRKVKCDETQPCCSNCCKYGVLCNFPLGVPDLQPAAETKKGRCLLVRHKHPKDSQEQQPRRRSSLQILPQTWTLPSPPIRPAISNGIWSSDGRYSYLLDAHDWVLFTQFRLRTVYSLGGEQLVNIYEDHLLQKCFTHPFLMHGTLAVTAVHARYLATMKAADNDDPVEAESFAPISVRESFHISRCTSLFNHWLSQPLTEENKDPLWSAAGSLSILTFSSVTTTRPGQAWPLGPPDPAADLEWLRLGAGKMTLWAMVNPTRQSSVFRPVFEVMSELRATFMNSTAPLLPEMAIICGIDETSTPETNPYFSVAQSLSRLLPLPLTEATLGAVLMVANKMHGPFEQLLHQRDPVALLLLSLWYAKARKCKWWIEFRARHEIPAIYQYLKRNHPAHGVIYSLLCQFGAVTKDLSP
ncbi:hypothetical protein SCUCBS95973_009645 [Sporothrix curviconia]|uniref:Zn(2)-C6 fungal-type domain-containing protein n=1 Tax=Sporothrix curviconia TaxID=1260050 RepID=A0ABP0CYB3_9PEZI